MLNHRTHARRIVGFLALGTLAITAFGFAVMTLWNGLLPPLFGLKAIGYWQALGLLVLSRILFGGFHSHRGGRFSRRRQVHLLERWDHMSPEEKERFRRGMHHCGCRREKPEGFHTTNDGQS